MHLAYQQLVIYKHIGQVQFLLLLEKNIAMTLMTCFLIWKDRNALRQPGQLSQNRMSQVKSLSWPCFNYSSKPRSAQQPNQSPNIQTCWIDFAEFLVDSPGQKIMITISIFIILLLVVVVVVFRQWWWKGKHKTANRQMQITFVFK